MPELDVQIGGRSFTVACQDGEERYLHAAAGLLDREAQVLVKSGARLTADRMLLMAGLMLADRAISANDELRGLDERLAAQTKELEALRAGPAREPEIREVEKEVLREVEVVREVVPDDALARLDALAERAEAVASKASDRLG